MDGANVDVDSRHYAFAYELHSIEDVPLDFGARAPVPEFLAGLFLPRDKPGWFGHSSYPPRLLLLTEGGVVILPHPSAKESAQPFALERLCFIESGHILLTGWLRFAACDFDRTLCYNTRDWKPVEAFMQRLRANFPDACAAGSGQTSVNLGDALDLKFGRALSAELDAGEVVRAALFRPAREFAGKLLIRRRRWTAADLIALTTRRLIWITDRYNGGYSRYGSIARYAAARSVARMERAREGGARILRVTFHSCEHAWVIPLSDEHYEAAAWFESAFPLDRASIAIQPAP